MIPYLSALAMVSSHNRALYKCPITLLTYFVLLGLSEINVPAERITPSSAQL